MLYADPHTACLLGAQAQHLKATGLLHPLFVIVLAVLFLDGAKHLLISIRLRAYTPGVVTAALLELPYGGYALYHFLQAGLLAWGELLRWGALGLILAGPLLWLGFAMGRWLVPRRHQVSPSPGRSSL